MDREPNEQEPIPQNSDAAGMEDETEIRSWKITVSRDRCNAFLTYSPSEGEELPDSQEILDEAKKLGVSETGLFAAEKLDKALENTFQSGIALSNYAICEDADSTFSIDVDDNKLKATLSIHKGMGRGKPLVLKDVGTAIRTSGLKKMDLDRVKEDILVFFRGPDLELNRYELVTGKQPGIGADRELKWECNFWGDKLIKELKKSIDDPPPLAFEGINSLEEFPIDKVVSFAKVNEKELVGALSPMDKGEAGVDVYGKTLEGNPGKTVEIRTHENITVEGNSIVAKREGVLEVGEIDGVINCRIRPHRDAKIAVEIPGDALSASVSLEEGEGTGTRLSAESVRQTLIEAEVIRGIDMEAVQWALDQATQQNVVDHVIVAKGVGVAEPANSSLQFAIDIASGKGVTIQENGKADFKNQDRMTSVSEGDLIADVITPEEKREDGWDVRGNVIPAKEAPAFNLEIGDNVKKERDDKGKLKLYAAISGELLYEGNSLDVINSHMVQGDVGLATGNIRFDGSVNVSGSVLPGFMVISKGTIKIAEGVEASLLSAEKSIHILQGIKGAGKAALRAREDISAAFAEQANLMAVGNINIQNACFHCTVKSNGAVALEGEKGHLVGGVTRAKKGIKVANLGTKNGVKTHVSFGQDYLIGDKIELEEKELNKLKEASIQTDSNIARAEREGDAAQLEQSRGEKRKILKLIDRRTERLFWLRERFEQHFASEVEVRGTAFPGVVLESHDRTLDITSEKRGVCFYFNEKSGKIMEKAKEGES